MPQVVVHHSYEIGQCVGVATDPVPTKPTKFMIVGVKVLITSDGTQVRYQISTLVDNYSNRSISVTEATGNELYAWPEPAAEVKDTDRPL